MMNLMNKLMLPCHGATELMEKKLREKLSFGEKTQLFMHTAMCGACHQYQKQSRLLERIFKTKEKVVLTNKPEIETKELEEKIIRELDSMKN